MNTSSSRTRTPRRLALVAAVALPLAVGCAGVFQSMGARWVTRQLADEFDLNAEQTKATRASVDRLIDAAPEVLGPPLKQIVQSSDKALTEGLTEQNIIPIERQIDSLADEVVARILDEAAPLVATLNDKQIHHAEQRFQQRFDLARESLDKPAAERSKQRQDEAVDSVTEVAGKLSSRQQTSIRLYVAKLPDDTAVRIAADERRVQGIADFVRSHPGAPAIRTQLWQSWKDRRDWGPEGRSPEARDTELRDALISLDHLLTPDQREHTREYLWTLYRRLDRFLNTDENT